MLDKSYLNDQTYYKSNYSKALEYIVPKYLIYDDLNNFGEDVDLKDKIINCHIDIASDISSILNVSSISGTVFSSINSYQGISKYFIKQNRLSEITPELFHEKILDRVNLSYSDFNSSGEFKNYIDSTLLPSIRLNYPSLYFSKGEIFSGVHTYLIDNLSWLYLLNTSGPITNVFSEISDLIASNLYFGKSININDCIKLLMKFIWKNELKNYYPSIFISSTGKYVSGTQQLDKLNTWIDIIYSPLYSDRSDFTVRDRFDLYRESKLKIKNKIPDGPFHKLLQIISLAAFDINDGNEKLKSLNDIESCPTEFLPLLADLIGWKLFGSDPDRWRLQIRNAVSIYKKAGTKKSIQFALNNVFPKDVFSIESELNELWESYVPYLIYYSLATESPYFESNDTWTLELANDSEIGHYSYSSIDENIRLVTDRIIYELKNTSSVSSNFNFPSNLSSFNYRGRDYSIPPFEEYPYYVNVELDKKMIDLIVDRLICFGVNRSFANKVGQYITSNTLDVDNLARSNSWLFFTSGYNEPPNISNLISNIENKKLEYASLWSGKSSHFKLDLSANDFDFSRKDEKEDAGDAPKILSQIISEYAPAHAIPLLNLNLHTIDYAKAVENLFRVSQYADQEHGNKGLINYQTSALYVSSYKRNTSAGHDLQRGTMETLQSPLLKNSTTITDVPRNTLRRRSYEKIMPFETYYDRTGFNMPIALDNNFTTDRIPLGLIPSSLSYQSISDYNNLPDVYSKCNDLASSASYYGYYVSSTVSCRGGRELSPELALKKNLVILAGQSNMNGKGSSSKGVVTDVNYWDIDASSFKSLIPFGNTQIDAPFQASTYNNTSSFWGPEVRFAELLRDNSRKDTYLFKFCQDNSLVVNSEGNNTWCPSTTQIYPLYNRFSSALDLAISSLGGMSKLKNVTLIWSQGESEAGFGQQNNSSAIAFSAATMYFLDTVREKFLSPINFKIIRAKIHKDFGAGSQPDYQYYPSGQLVPNAALATAFPQGFSAVSAPGSYGFWSWSSTSIARQGQDNLNTDIYGPLINFDDLTFTNESNFDGSSPAFPPTILYIGAEGDELIVSAYASAASFINSSIHYDNSSLDIVGERFYHEWENIVGERIPKPSKGFHISRDQLDPIYATMHDIIEKRKIYQASANYPVPNASSILAYRNYLKELIWKNIYQSYSNYATEVSGWGISSVESYYNFTFGNDLHKLYNIYTKEFNRHRITEDLNYLDGANIFSHVYGPLLYNHNFDYLGSSNLVNSSLLISNQNTISKYNIFASANESIGVYSSIAIFNNGYDLYNSSIIDGIDLVSISGSVNSNYFGIIKIPFSEKKESFSDYMFNRTFVKMDSVGGSPYNQRLRFDISRKNLDPKLGYPIQNNFLLPEHEFKLNLKGIVINTDGTESGGPLGVWIHTQIEDGKYWSYNVNGKWVRHSVDEANGDYFPDRSQYIHVLNTPEVNRYITSSVTQSESGFRCIETTQTINEILPIQILNENAFYNLTLKFNTYNSYCIMREHINIMIDKDYGLSYGQVHRRIKNTLLRYSLLLLKTDIFY